MAAIDNSPNVEGLESPADDAAAVAPHDSNELSYITRGLFVGTGGNVKVVMKGGQTVTFTAVPDGTLLPIRVTQVFDTDTTADDIVALW